MATSYRTEYCQYMQNDPLMYKMKVGKFHFMFLWYFGVIVETSLWGRGDRVHPPSLDRVKHPAGETGAKRNRGKLKQSQ